MGGSLAKAVSRKDGTDVLLYDKNTEKADRLARDLGARSVSLRVLAAECDFIFLGVKPSIIGSVCSELAPMLSARDGYTLVTMAAGVTLSSVEGYLGFSAPVIRIMPNTPVAYGGGMILYTHTHSVGTDTLLAFVSSLSEAGRLDCIDERLIDAASAISGCGPAFAYMFIESLADGGVAAGLPREKAETYAAQMLMGSAQAMLLGGGHPAELKDAVCSPGGSTIEGVIALEDGGFRGTVANAVIKSYEKTVKLGK